MPGKPSVYILDSSFFLSGYPVPDGELFTIPNVVEEVRPDRKELDFARSKGLQVMDPPEEAIRTVKDSAQRTGDLGRLSDTDICILALALHKKGILISDDYSVQNTASFLGIQYASLLEQGISKVVTWYHRCSYCGRYDEEDRADCTTCGGPMRRTRRPPSNPNK